MSLYTPESLIRKLIMEAEELTLNPSAEADAVPAAGSSPMDVASSLAASQPAQGAPGLQGSTLQLPQVTPPASTISKTVINKDIILSQLAELKSVITNYEKQFEGDDLTPEDANVYISSLLSTLVFHAEKLNNFMESTPGSEEESAPAPEEPVAEPSPELASPEAGTPPAEAPPESGLM